MDHEQKAREISSYISNACGGLGYASRYRELEQRITSAIQQAVEAETERCANALEAKAEGLRADGDKRYQSYNGSDRDYASKLWAMADTYKAAVSAIRSRTQGTAP